MFIPCRRPWLYLITIFTFKLPLWFLLSPQPWKYTHAQKPNFRHHLYKNKHGNRITQTNSHHMAYASLAAGGSNHALQSRKTCERKNNRKTSTTEYHLNSYKFNKCFAKLCLHTKCIIHCHNAALCELSPVSTTRVDWWPVSTTRQHGPCWRAPSFH